MNYRPARLASVVSVASLGLAAACSPVTSGDDTGVHVRVAHLSPDAPSVDFCVASHGTSAFSGPVLATSGQAAGLSYGQVTKYLDLAADRYDVRLVAPGAASCATSLGGLADFTNLPELNPGDSATIAAEGLVAFGSATPLALAAYIDDDAVGLGRAKLRFIHASPGTPGVDVGIGGGVAFTPVFTNVVFGTAAASANGYVETAPLAGVEISARAHGAATDALSIKPTVLPAGAIATAFAIGELGNATAPLRVLLCADNAAPTGLLSQCSIVGGTPSRAHVRVAHLSPDLRAVDVCLAVAGTGAFSPPILASLGVPDGLTYAAVTTYVDLPIGRYDVRVIDANATGCSIPAIPDTQGVSVTVDQTATIASGAEGRRGSIESPRKPAPRTRRSIWIAAMAAAVTLAIGGGWLLRGGDRGEVAVAPADARAALLANAGDARAIAWTATADAAAHGASGDVVWSAAKQRGYMRFVGLAANDPKAWQYQLWIFDRTRDQAFPVDGGVFDVSSTGEVVVTISAKLHVDDPTLFAVTVERPGGVVVSKRERIVVTATPG